MALTVPSRKARVNHKPFTCRTQLEWTGGRGGILSAEGKPAYRVSSPPEFKGQEGIWSSEDLFVAAVDICTMATFLTFANQGQILLVEYKSQAEGQLEFVDGSYRFTRITLRPEIIVESTTAIADVQKVLHDAHSKCLVSNSIKPEVVIEPVIKYSRSD
ncbi:MAG: OsmC family protein [Acidobacteria bacterium]|nr:OsmC family protein [Acidobacteriota bacterium]MBI3656513.1 OsmC family protein [Acidobacteriota bacterium]